MKVLKFLMTVIPGFFLVWIMVVDAAEAGWQTQYPPFTSSDTFCGVWGSSGNNVFAVGASGRVFHYDGPTTSYGSTTGTKSAGTGASDVTVETALADVAFTTESTLCPECSGDPLVLQDLTFMSGTTCECAAATALTLKSGVTIESGASLTFESNIIVIEGGVHIEAGAAVLFRAGTSVTIERGAVIEPGTTTFDAPSVTLEGFATTQSATAITCASAVLNGTANPSGFETAVVFEWGTDTTYGNEIVATQSPLLAGNTDQSVSAELTGLAMGETYHYRVKTSNPGTGYGGDVAFTTLSGGGVLYVNASGDCAGNTPCYPTIQAAIDAECEGANIKIAQGTYDESLSPNEPKSLTLSGGWNSSFTTQTPNTTFVSPINDPWGYIILQNVNLLPEGGYVCNDGTCGGKTPCYTSIQAAIDAAIPGANIMIALGTYDESISPNESKSLTLSGGWDSSFSSQTQNTTFVNPINDPQGLIGLHNVSFIAESSIYVSQADSCGGKTPCYTTIQGAIDAAPTGSEILISQGIFTEVSVLSASKSLTIRGGWNSSFVSQSPNTTFARITNTQGSITSQCITNLDEVLIVTTTAASSITSNNALSGGNVVSDGGAPVTARGVCWSTAANPTISDSKTSDGTGTGPFTSSITGLAPGTTYHVRAYATNSTGTAYGDDESFITVGVVPTVVTDIATSVTTNSATLNGTVNPNGASTTVTFEYGSTTNYGSTASASPSHLTGTTSQSVYANISALNANATYHFRVKATNSAGTTYGSDLTFTTTSTIPTVTTAAISSITTNTASSGGNVTSDGGSSLIARGVCWGTSTNPTILNSKTTDGTAIGSFASMLFGLSPGTPYHVRAYATNSAGTGYGIDLSFTTASPPKAKAIIMAGGPIDGNNIWDDVEMISSYAFRALVYQGYTKEAIYYLSPNTLCDIDGDSVPDVDAEATADNLEYAIKTWSQDAEELFVYLIGHGYKGKFKISSSEILNAEDLDTWLDDIQNRAFDQIVVLYDACYSGSFLALLSPPTGKERILATSVSSDEASLFCAKGTLSFSYLFWSRIYNGDGFYDSFVCATNSVAIAFPNRMNPQLEGNWNGVGNEKEDKNLASLVEIGFGIQTGADLPTVGSATASPQSVSAGNSSLLYAEDVVAMADVLRVWAVITPPDYSNSPDSPVTDLPMCDFSLNNGRYEGTYGGFTTEGTYNIAVFVEDKEGFVSLPVQTTVAVSPAGAPVASTGSADPITSTTATLKGTINPNGGETTYYFEYGETASYGQSTANNNAGAGISNVSVGVPISGLTADTTYHFRVVATNSGGTSYGSDRTFTTLSSCPDCGGNKVTITNKEFGADTRSECTASESITLGNGVKINQGATMIFRIKQE